MINCTTLSGGDPNGSIPSPWKRPDGTVDGSEIPNNHLGCIKPCKWDKLPFPQLVQDFFHQQYAWVQTILLAALLKVSSEAYPQKETSWLFFYVNNHISQINQTLQLKKTDCQTVGFADENEAFQACHISPIASEKGTKSPTFRRTSPNSKFNLGSRGWWKTSWSNRRENIQVLPFHINHYLNCFFSGFLKDQQ